MIRIRSGQALIKSLRQVDLYTFIDQKFVSFASKSGIFVIYIIFICTFVETFLEKNLRQF